MNRTERADWIDDMKAVGKYQHLFRQLEEGENETDSINAILGILDYVWGGNIAWRRMWTHYPKFGNPVINIELVTNTVVDLAWVKSLLPMAGKISHYDTDSPRHFWNAVRATGTHPVHFRYEEE